MQKSAKIFWYTYIIHNKRSYLTGPLKSLMISLGFGTFKRLSYLYFFNIDSSIFFNILSSSFFTLLWLTAWLSALFLFLILLGMDFTVSTGFTFDSSSLCTESIKSGSFGISCPCFTKDLVFLSSKKRKSHLFIFISSNLS